MQYECKVPRHENRESDKTNSGDAIYLARFMVWAYDEVSQNLKDDVLQSAIKAILYYMSKRYGIDPAESGALTGADRS
jgi:hypothetical protein